MAKILGTASNDDGIASGTLFDLSADLFSTLNANWSTGDDVMIGGGGNDTYYVNSVGDVVLEAVGQGTDTVVSRLTDYTLSANCENLTLDWSAVNGTGNELNNVIDGNGAANTLRGDAGNDRLNGKRGDDRLLGGAGNDTLDGASGVDTMAGGPGDDVYYVNVAGDRIYEDALQGGIDLVYSGVDGLTLEANVENLILQEMTWINRGTGNAGNNVLTGSRFMNMLSGLDGNDLLRGLGANDVLVGGAGDDTLDGGANRDCMSGGTGDDTYYVDEAGDSIEEALLGGSDTVLASISETLDAYVENLTLQNVAAAGNGTGNALANTLLGNAFANILNGAGGVDTLFGGLGNDRFVLGGRGVANADAIADFKEIAGDDDLIVLSGVLDSGLRGALSAGILGLSFSGGADPSRLEPGDVLAAARFFKGEGFDGNGGGSASGLYVNTVNGQIYYNPTSVVGGDSLLIGRVGLAAVTALDNADFIYGL